jgi:hypothetical protein
MLLSKVSLCGHVSHYSDLDSPPKTGEDTPSSAKDENVPPEKERRKSAPFTPQPTVVRAASDQDILQIKNRKVSDEGPRILIGANISTDTSKLTKSASADNEGTNRI